MKREIRVRHGDIQKIADMIGRSHLSVSNYLQGKTYSRSAEKAREIALTVFDGVEVKPKEDKYHV